MGLFSKLFHEFVDVIEWTDDTSNTMVYRFERYGNEIKYGAKLIVRESQFAVFVNEGEVADVLGPGTYELETKNLPVLTTLQNWHHGFQSPFKIVGTEGVFTTDEISSQLRNLITSRFATIIGTSNIPILDMAANYDQLGDFLTQRIAPEFGEYGLQLTRILVENISLPPAVSEALDKRTSMGMTGNLDRYLQYQTGVSMEAGAQNTGGGASDGIGMGIGLAMANRMNESIGGHSNTSTPPPLPSKASELFHVASNGSIVGPYTVDLLRQQAAAGTLDADTLVWSPGMSEWQMAGSVDTLKSVLKVASVSPPPIPSA